MASVNKVILIGRLTRDVECRTFANGGKVAQFGFAVDGARKKNPNTGQWESEPCFLDCKAFNRGVEGRLADNIEQYLRKGSQAFVEGHLVLEQWTDKEGGKRSKLVVMVDVVQFLDSKGQREEPRRAQETDAMPAGVMPEGEGESIPF